VEGGGDDRGRDRHFPSFSAVFSGTKAKIEWWEYRKWEKIPSSYCFLSIFQLSMDDGMGRKQEREKRDEGRDRVFLLLSLRAFLFRIKEARREVEGSRKDLSRFSFPFIFSYLPS